MDPLQLYIQRRFPNSTIWPAKIQEDIYDVNFDGIKGCNDVEGIAVDEDSNGTPDRFFFKEAGFKIDSVTSKRLGDFLLPLTCEIEKSKTNGCRNPIGNLATDIRFVPPEIKGRLFPDSFGRIDAIAMLDSDMTEPVIAQLLEAKPGLKFLLFDLQTLAVKTRRTASGSGYESSPNVIHQPADYLGTLWLRDSLKAGRNEIGLPFAIDPLNVQIDDLAGPYAREFGAMVYRANVLIDGGNMLTTSRSTFVHGFIHPLALDDIQNTTAYGNKIITIESIPSAAAHLDMILTPLEDKIDGKPVIILAEVVKQEKWGGPDFVTRFYDRLLKDEQRVIDSIRESLQGSFTIIPIPIVYNGDFIRANPLPFGPPGTRPIAYSYNNVLIERYVEKGEIIRRVYMPWYENLDEINEKAKEVYEDLGYEVIKIKHIDSLAQFGGSLRCMTVVLERH